MSFICSDGELHASDAMSSLRKSKTCLEHEMKSNIADDKRVRFDRYCVTSTWLETTSSTVTPKQLEVDHCQ